MATLVKLLLIAAVAYGLYLKFRHPLPISAPHAASAGTLVPRIAGRRTILLSSTVPSLALLAGLFLNVFTDASAIDFGLSIYLLPWFYPVLAAASSWRMVCKLARLLAGLAVLTGLALLVRLDRSGIPLLFSTTYMTCTLAFLVGVVRYTKVWSFGAAPRARSPAP